MVCVSLVPHHSESNLELRIRCSGRRGSCSVSWLNPERCIGRYLGNNATRGDRPWTVAPSALESALDVLQPDKKTNRSCPKLVIALRHSSCNNYLALALGGVSITGIAGEGARATW